MSRTCARWQCPCSAHSDLGAPAGKKGCHDTRLQRRRSNPARPNTTPSHPAAPEAKNVCRLTVGYTRARAVDEQAAHEPHAMGLTASSNLSAVAARNATTPRAPGDAVTAT